MVAAPPPSGVPDGFLHCESTHLTDFGGVVKIPLSAEELINELRGIKFNFFTLDELAGALSSFSVADNPAIFTVITLSTAIDVAFIFFTHWRWRRRRLAGSRRRAVGKKAKRDEAELAAIFSAFDADGSGKIDADEMVEALARAGKPMERDEVEKIVKTVDKNNDGEIDLDEFKAIFKLSPEMLPARLQELVEAGDVLGAAQAGYQPKNWKESLRLKVHAHLAAQKEIAEAGLQNPDAEKMDAAQKAMAMAIGRMQTMARRTQTLAQMSYEERTRASQAVQKGVRRWKARAQAQLEAKELARQRAVRGSSWVPSQAVFGPLPGLTDKSTTSGLMYGARPVDPSWSQGAKAGARARLSEQISDNRQRLAERRRELMEQVEAKRRALSEVNAKETAIKSLALARTFRHEFIRTMQSEHTIVAAVAPNPEDSAGDHLRDENVVHIFFLTMMSELCVLCLLRGGASVPVFSITTVINGLITTGSCGAFAIAAKRIFRFGNKLRWRRKDRTREDAAKLIQRRFRRRKMLRKRKKGLRGCCHRFLKRLRKLRRRLRRRLVRLLCFWRRDAKGGKYRVRAKGKAKAAKGSSKAGRKGRAPPRPSLKEMLARAAAEDAGQPGEGGVVKIGSFADLVKTKQREEHALFGRFPLTAPNALQGRAASRWITMHPRLHLFRFWLAWTINLGLYAAACVVCLAYGVLFSAPAFTELLVAWLLALGFTWAVVEPSEVLGIVLLPALSKNARVMACRAWCKDLGFF